MVHKTVNVLDKLPKGAQPKVKAALHEISGAETKAGAEKAFELFVRTYQAKYPKATECLEKDKGALLAFFDFPAEHGRHIGTTNPIESVFSTVRLRHEKTKGSGTRAACLTMVFKRMESASKGWRALNGSPACWRKSSRGPLRGRHQGRSTPPERTPSTTFDNTPKIISVITLIGDHYIGIMTFN